MTELREFFPAVKKLSDMGGTFCVDSHGHSAEVCASWEYVPEAREEENRVSGAGRDDAPERWFIPAPDTKNWGHVAGTPQKARVYGAISAFVPVEELSGELENACPIDGPFDEYVPKCPDLTDAIVELLNINPASVWQIYNRAWKNRLLNVREALIKAMRIITHEPYFAIKEQVAHFPNTYVTRRMRKALG